MICKQCNEDRLPEKFAYVRRDGRKWRRLVCKSCSYKNDHQTRLQKRLEAGDEDVKTCISCGNLTSRPKFEKCRSCRDKGDLLYFKEEKNKVFHHSQFAGKPKEFIRFMYDQQYKEFCDKKEKISREIDLALAVNNKHNERQLIGLMGNYSRLIGILNENRREFENGKN